MSIEAVDHSADLQYFAVFGCLNIFYGLR